MWSPPKDLNEFVRPVTYTIESIRYKSRSKIAILTYLGSREVFLSLQGAPQEVLALFQRYQYRQTYVYNTNESALTGRYSTPYIIFSDPDFPNRHNIAIYRTGEPIFEMWFPTGIFPFTMDTVEYDRYSQIVTITYSKIATITYNKSIDVSNNLVFLSLKYAPQEVIDGFIKPELPAPQLPWATPTKPRAQLRF